MRPLSAAQLLDAWERGVAQDSIDRALTLLAAASPDTTRETLAQLPIGARDALLLTLREWTFGAHLVSVTNCPNCGEWLEFAFDVADIRASVSPFQGETTEGVRSITLSVDGYALAFRLPNSDDLRAVTQTRELESAKCALLERCIVGVNETYAHETRELPGAIADAVAAKMAEADPQANVQLAFECPNCGHHRQATFDIVSFFWAEIDAWAQRILREVHTLASAYGWREADILALSPRRRQIYLDLIGE
jgi:predicted RNA-binding Zn-ribbon protein involved in translation (DUF1610 family)